MTNLEGTGDIPQVGKKEALAKPVSFLQLTPRIGFEPPDPHAQQEFRSALTQSDGRAVILIHPFFPETETVRIGRIRKMFRNRSYKKYVDHLTQTLADHRSQGLPLVLFEPEESLQNTPQIADRLGIKAGNIFTVPTREGSPAPITEMLTVLTDRLKDLGLEHAIVLGSRLDLLQRDKTRDENLHALSVHGCVGVTIKDLVASKINVSTGTATFPQ